MSQKIVNQDIRRFFLSYTLAKESKYKEGNALREAIVRLLLSNQCLEIKGYTYSCLLFTSRKDKGYDFWQKQIYREFKGDIRFVFGEVDKRDVAYGEFEIGRFKSLRHEDKAFTIQFEQLVKKVDYEIKYKVKG